MFQDNLFDSLHFKVRMNIDLDKKEKYTSKDFMAIKGQIKHTQPIKLKKDQFNFILLSYLRQVKK